MQRREFLTKCAQLGIGTVMVGGLAGCARDQIADTGGEVVDAVSTGQPHQTDEATGEAAPPATDLRVGSNRRQPPPAGIDLVVARDMKPPELVQAAINKFGGITSWIKPGDVVTIKPNLAWARQPAQAATTSPEVLAAVIGLCQQAQPKRIVVVEHSCDTASVSFEMSGAKQVCRELGIPLVSLSNENMYQEVALPAGSHITTDKIAREILECDVYINLPIVKSHSATVATVALKNQMGTVWDRGAYHKAGAQQARGMNLHQNIVGLAASLRPTLNIVDATRLLVTGGPKGPGKVEERHTILVSADMLAVDAYAATLLGLKPEDIPYIEIAAQAGIGKGDLETIKVAAA